MMLVGKIIVFLLGMGVAVQVVAAFYRIIDLWYTIRTEYPRVIRGIVFWCGISSLIAFLVGDNLRNTFLGGMIFYIPFYLANFFLLQSIIKYRYKKAEQDIHDEQQEESH
ncbi:MAG: hypothetical protein Q3M30_13590 [Candidatus Electrothrix sp. Rat3]|nr:hypothetical protein [Candidatus Electrothrix rattekaaiensis]